MKARPTDQPGEVTLELGTRDEPLMEAAARLAVKSPFRIKHILVPIDFSECSKKALQYALPLAIANEAKLSLLHVVESLYSQHEAERVGLETLTAGMMVNGEHELSKLIEEQVHGDAVAHALVRIGSPANNIVDVAKATAADLIVISTHGRSGFKHLVLGSVTEHVVRRAPCPVLVVREHEHDILNS